MEEAEELALSTLKQVMRKRSVRIMLIWRELFKIRDSILLRRKLVFFLIDWKMRVVTIRVRVIISLKGSLSGCRGDFALTNRLAININAADAIHRCAISSCDLSRYTTQ